MTVNPRQLENNFILRESTVSMDVELEIPLHGSLAGAALKDTVEMDFRDNKHINWIELNINVFNGFPLEAKIQVDFLDEQNQKLFSLFENYPYNIIESGLTDDEGYVVMPRNKLTRVMLNQIEILKLAFAKSAVISANFGTSSNGEKMIRILSDYEISVNIGARINAQATISF
jgi:hypothetical protein